MANLFTDSTCFLVDALKSPSTMDFPCIVGKLHNVNKSLPITFGCIYNNELNGPGSGNRIRCGRQPQLIYFHNDVVLYRASSQKPVHFAGFFKRVMVPVKIFKKGDFPGNLLMDPAAQGLLFVFSHRVHRERRWLQHQKRQRKINTIIYWYFLKIKRSIDRLILKETI